MSIYAFQLNSWGEGYSRPLKEVFMFYEMYCGEQYARKEKPMDYHEYFKGAVDVMGVSPDFAPSDCCIGLEPEYSENNEYGKNMVSNLIEPHFGSYVTPSTAVYTSFVWGAIYKILDAETGVVKGYFCKGKQFETEDEVIKDMNEHPMYYEGGWKTGV